MGYGDFSARLWFVGMEEAGGNTLEDVQNRIGNWAERGRSILEDCAEYHQAIGEGHLFTPTLRVAQKTWDWLIRTQLKLEGKAYGADASKVMQAERWLRKGSKTCGIELLPLPSPDASTWHYAHFSTDRILRDRVSYSEAMLPKRIRFIRNAIDEHKPRHVVFYSKKYLNHWQEISGKHFFEVNGLHIAETRDTLFICTSHPTARISGGPGAKISYWESVGEKLLSCD